MHRRFRKRFMLLSAGFHALPLAALALLPNTPLPDPPPTLSPQQKPIRLVSAPPSQTTVFADKQQDEAKTPLQSKQHQADANPSAVATPPQHTRAPDAVAQRAETIAEPVASSTASKPAVPHPSSSATPAPPQNDTKEHDQPEDYFTSANVVSFEHGLAVETAAKERRSSIEPAAPAVLAPALPSAKRSRVKRPMAVLGELVAPSDKGQREVHSHEQRRPKANEPILVPDNSAALAEIQGKVGRMARIALIALGEPDLAGAAKVQMILNRFGYVDGWRIVKSTGFPMLDREVHDVLHMGEPYAYISGWFEIEVPFSR